MKWRLARGECATIGCGRRALSTGGGGDKARRSAVRLVRKFHDLCPRCERRMRTRDAMGLAP